MSCSGAKEMPLKGKGAHSHSGSSTIVAEDTRRSTLFAPVGADGIAISNRIMRSVD